MRPMYFTIPFGPHPELLKVQGALEKLHPELNFTDPAKFHITVAYVHDAGDVDLRHVKLPKRDAFDVRCTNIQQWETKDGWAIVLGVEKKGPLPFMQASLYQQIKGRGCKISEYSMPSAYKPHITLAYSEKPLGELVLHAPIEIPVRNMTLSEDEYKVVKRWPLRSGQRHQIKGVQPLPSKLVRSRKSTPGQRMVMVARELEKYATALDEMKLHMSVAVHNLAVDDWSEPFMPSSVTSVMARLQSTAKSTEQWYSQLRSTLRETINAINAAKRDMGG